MLNGCSAGLSACWLLNHPSSRSPSSSSSCQLRMLFRYRSKTRQPDFLQARLLVVGLSTQSGYIARHASSKLPEPACSPHPRGVVDRERRFRAHGSRLPGFLTVYLLALLKQRQDKVCLGHALVERRGSRGCGVLASGSSYLEVVAKTPAE